MRKKHWWILPALAILVVLTLIALDERLILRTYTVASPKLTAEVRLAVVTDFHSSDNADDVVEMLASCAPDAVLLVGDMFDDDIANRPTERTLSLMRQLSAQYPCYYVSGNHEAWTGEMDALYQQTEEAGVTVLRMSSGVLTVRGQRIALCGIPDPYEMVFSGAPDTEEQIRQAMYYFGIILFFAVGAGIGGNLSMRLGFKAIWFSSAVLAVSFLLMFIEEKEKSLC